MHPIDPIALFTHFKTNTKCLGIYRVLRCCAFKNQNIVKVMKWARLLQTNRYALYIFRLSIINCHQQSSFNDNPEPISIHKRTLCDKIFYSSFTRFHFITFHVIQVHSIIVLQRATLHLVSELSIFEEYVSFNCHYHTSSFINDISVFVLLKEHLWMNH